MIPNTSIAEQIASLRAGLERAETEPTSVQLLVDATRERLTELEQLEADLARRGYRSVREDEPGAVNISVTLDTGRDYLVPAVPR